MHQSDLGPSMLAAIIGDGGMLVIHGPPLGRTGRSDFAAASTRSIFILLLREVQGRGQPQLRIFGHIHDVRTKDTSSEDGKTTSVNDSKATEDAACRRQLAARSRNQRMDEI